DRRVDRGVPYLPARGLETALVPASGVVLELVDREVPPLRPDRRARQRQQLRQAPGVRAEVVEVDDDPLGHGHIETLAREAPGIRADSSLSHEGAAHIGRRSGGSVRALVLALGAGPAHGPRRRRAHGLGDRAVPGLVAPDVVLQAAEQRLRVAGAGDEAAGDDGLLAWHDEDEVED